ncbi:MAG: 1-phosphofructokinase family hexose kinase [Trueperaceae bacterium]|nr:1-phosphofructokinase family hexose kinase [Trueperaceae bacterium]
MIHTLTVNPALDLTYRVPALRYDDTVRASTVHRAAGGKGVNVSRVATRLGHATIAMGFAGGRAGEELLDLLRAEEVRTWFSWHDGRTRTNAILQDDAGRQVRVSGPGPEVQGPEIEALTEAVFELRVPDALVLSGSLLPGMPSDYYARLSGRAAEDGVTVAVDTDRHLRASLAAGATVIKPNAFELGRLVGQSVDDAASARRAGEAARALGAEIVVCSLGAQGAVWIGAEGAWLAVPPRVEVDSALGAGDALLAGVLVARADGADPAEALRLGVACGTATALTPGTDLCRRDDVERVRAQVTVERLD